MTKLLTKCCTAALLLAAVPACPQAGKIEVKKNLNYRQKVTPVKADHYLYSTFCASGKNVYNLKGFQVCGASGRVLDLRLSPAGSAFAVLTQSGKQTKVAIYDANTADKRIHDFSETTATAIAYSADSRRLFIAGADGSLQAYDTKTFEAVSHYQPGLIATCVAADSRGRFLAAAGRLSVAVMAAETGAVRTRLDMAADVNAVRFSDDGSMMGVLTADGQLTLYDSRSLTVSHTFSTLGAAVDFDFHPEGKYVAVATAANAITFINIMDAAETIPMSEPAGGISYLRFVRDGKGQVYLTNTATDALKYRQVTGLSPNYMRMMRQELLSRMEEWAKMRDDETEDEYRQRVNEDTRARQARLFEQEIATQLAGDMAMNASVSLGGYNPATGMMAVEFDNMPPIALKVPQEDAQDFMSGADLEFRDAVYGLTENDGFELIFANVYNRTTGKTYQFNNLDRKRNFLNIDDDFVPIELVQKSGMEEMRLNELRQKVVGQAQRDKLISEHTHIAVNTQGEADTDPAGRKVTNYKVGFTYTVDDKYSAHEDFPAGRYKVRESHAAESMLKIVTQAFENDFAKYIKAGKRVVVRITGSADALPITGTIAYDGTFGDIVDEPYHLNGDLSTVTVKKATGIKSNEQLAYMRAMAVKDYIGRSMTALNQMNTDYDVYVEVNSKAGGAYRRINVEFVFVDTF